MPTKFCLIIFSLLYFHPAISFAQSKKELTNRVVVKHNTGSSSFGLSTKTNIKSKSDKVSYYWYKSREIQTSKGGYSGKLLHGEYISHDVNNGLKEKGFIKHGLKQGKWIMWHENGEIAKKTVWAKGKLTGTSFEYDEGGKLFKRTQYKNGIPRKVLNYVNDTIVSRQKFDANSKLIIKKEKKPKLKKSEVENLQPDTIKNDKKQKIKVEKQQVEKQGIDKQKEKKPKGKVDVKKPKESKIESEPQGKWKFWKKKQKE